MDLEDVVAAKQSITFSLKVVFYLIKTTACDRLKFKCVDEAETIYLEYHRKMQAFKKKWINHDSYLW